MTAPADIARAYDAFFDLLVRGPWVTHPEQASANLEARRRELQEVASRLDRSLWPPGVGTLLWTPAPHEMCAVPAPPPATTILDSSSDCPACE